MKTKEEIQAMKAKAASGEAQNKAPGKALDKAPALMPMEKYFAKPDIQQKIANVLPMVNPNEREIMKQALLGLMIEANNHNPKLAACSQESKLEALLDCARTGLVPFTAMNEAYIIPYGNEAKFQFGYRGIIRLCRNTGLFKDIYAKVVREGDDFSAEIYRSEQVINYKQSPLPIYEKVRTHKGNKYFYEVKELRPIVSFVGVFTLINGGMNYEVTSREDMEIHRDKYCKTNLKDPDAVWNKDFPQMGKKTILGTVLNHGPKSEKLVMALRLDETMRDIVPLPQDFTPEAQVAYEEHRRTEVEGETVITVEGKEVKEKTEKKASEDAKKKAKENPENAEEKTEKTENKSDAGLKAGVSRHTTLWQEGHKRGKEVAAFREDIKEAYKLESITDLTIGQYDEVMAALKKIPVSDAKFNKDGQGELIK